MFIKSLTAAALAVALSSTAFAGQVVYQGGPKSAIRASTPSFEANKPFAQDVNARAGKQGYQGGPKTSAPQR